MATSRSHGILRLAKLKSSIPKSNLFAVLIIAYRREFVKFGVVLRIADVPLAPPLIAGEMRVDAMAAGRFGYRRLQRLFDLVLLLAKALFLCVLF